MIMVIKIMVMMIMMVIIIMIIIIVVIIIISINSTCSDYGSSLVSRWFNLVILASAKL